MPPTIIKYISHSLVFRNALKTPNLCVEKCNALGAFIRDNTVYQTKVLWRTNTQSMIANADPKLTYK